MCRTWFLLIALLVFSAMRASQGPAELPEMAWATAALVALMAILWLSEALPLAVTALIPLVAVPMLGIAPISAIAVSYANPLVFLFLGGFFIAQALVRWDLHRRIAARVLSLSPSGPAGLMASLMIATAFLSMWISNTATAMVMLPIAQAIAGQANTATGGEEPAAGPKSGPFAAALVLAVAFSATIGGMASQIGTPPNALLAAYLAESHGIVISFSAWLQMGVPLAAVLLIVAWNVLSRLLLANDPDAGATTRRESVFDHSLATAPMSTGARLTAVVAALTAVALIFRPMVQQWLPGAAWSDAGIAMAGALLLFAIPSFKAYAGSSSESRGNRDGEVDTLLRWQDVAGIRWDVLILFGGGLALASVIQSSGLATAIADLFVRAQGLPLPIVILSGMLIVVLLGELASNTAIAAVFLPIAGASAVSSGLAPLELLIPVGLAASLGFMLPVATPPNAIAYGTGLVSSGQMLHAGAVLDAISVPIVYLVASTLGSMLLG